MVIPGWSETYRNYHDKAILLYEERQVFLSDYFGTLNFAEFIEWDDQRVLPFCPVAILHRHDGKYPRLWNDIVVEPVLRSCFSRG
jgi:hypothetical protein